MAAELLPVAQYLRMSTEHQQYSLDNQRQAIQAYADSHNMSVVKTYEDGAKSGVVLKRRDGLRQLLQDAMGGDPEYKAILVYDVSRWGRFQDADESAHYEFLCKSAGVSVHYCAETFINDGTLPSMLMKALKRTMAGEYSRELGVKVLAGLKRLAGLGFKQGGSPGYGLRRMLVSAQGEPKQQLAQGERKSIITDRVILVPGPVEEVECVREIYRMLIEEKRTVYGISRELNRRKIKYSGDSKWDYSAVSHILSHPKYAGCNVFGRTSQKLGTPSIRMPESEWILARNAFTSLVDEPTFQQAQNLLLARTINKSDDELLSALRSLLARHGRLSYRLIAETPEMPSPSSYRGRFGSLRRVYELIGYGGPETLGPIDRRRRTQALRDKLIREIGATFPGDVSIERRGGRWRSLLRLNTGLRVSVIIAHSIGTKSKGLTWQINPVPHERSYVTLLALLNGSNSVVEEMLLFPNIEKQSRFYVAKDNVWLKRGVLLKCESELLDAVRTISECLRRKERRRSLVDNLAGEQAHRSGNFFANNAASD
jgi:DNA invertase Pin-like site-specific DNA recombinase